MVRGNILLVAGIVLCVLTSVALAIAAGLAVAPTSTDITFAVTDEEQTDVEPLSDTEAILALIILVTSIILFFIRIRWLIAFWCLALLVLGDIALVVILSVLFLLWMGIKGLFGSDC